MDLQTYTNHKPIFGQAFFKEDLHCMGLGTTTKLIVEEPLSVADQQHQKILEELQRNSKSLWCPEEDEELQMVYEMLEKSWFKQMVPLLKQIAIF